MLLFLPRLRFLFLLFPGEQLYHAIAKINDYWVPGKAGAHLHGANIPFAGKEVRMVSQVFVFAWF